MNVLPITVLSMISVARILLTAFNTQQRSAFITVVDVSFVSNLISRKIMKGPVIVVLILSLGACFFWKVQAQGKVKPIEIPSIFLSSCNDSRSKFLPHSRCYSNAFGWTFFPKCMAKQRSYVRLPYH